MKEVLAHVQGEIDLPCRLLDEPTAARILLTVIEREPDAVVRALAE